MTTAPWVYRHRFIVFGLLYGFSFFFGYLIAGFVGTGAQPSYRTLGNREVLAGVALACALGGFCLRVWASSYLSSAVVWHGDPRSGELRVSGTYRFTRNPLYLGNILQAIAIGLVAPWPVLVLVVVGMIAYSYVLIAVEERYLSAMQGDTYERYKRSVGRLVPLPWRVAPAGTQRASLADGLRAESVIGLLSLAVFVIVFLTWR